MDSETKRCITTHNVTKLTLLSDEAHHYVGHNARPVTEQIREGETKITLVQESNRTHVRFDL